MSAKRKEKPVPRSRRQPKNRQRLIAAAAVVLVILAGMAAWLLPPKHEGGGAGKPASGMAAGAIFSLPDQAKTFAGYAGSASCRECHEGAFARWTNSHHALAERAPEAGRDGTAFQPAKTIAHANRISTARESGPNFELLTAGLTGAQQTFQVERVLGESPLRQMLVALPGGRLQATEAAWDPRSNEWFTVYGAEDRQPGEWGHWTGRGMNWNSMCANCHNTRARKNYSAANDAYDTAMAERGVGCEACHGPLRAHNDWQRAHLGKTGGDPTLPRLTRDQMLDACATCHARRGDITGDPKPGDSFYDHHLLAIVDHSELFYADGQVRDEDYEVTAFLGSRMFHSGVRCWDCHDAHAAQPVLPGNALCMKCHSGAQTNAPLINPLTHSHHQIKGLSELVNGGNRNTSAPPGQPAGSGGECVNCHMPQTVYMQRHVRHDHGFTIPDPQLSLESGIPNACNRCHTNQSAAWAQGFVAQWYGEKMNRPYRRHAQAAAGARRGETAARDELLAMLDHDPQFYWRAVAAGLLERWVGEPAVRAVLVNRLADTNALVRQAIVQCLATLGDSPPPEVGWALEARLRDSARNVRVMAAQAMAAKLDTNSLAAAELRHLLELGNDQPAGRLQMGLFQFARQELTNALEQFRVAARWDPGSAGVHHETAIVLSQLGRTPEALPELQEAVRLAPGEAEFHFKLGLAWNEVGENIKAVAELDTAVRLEPRHARAGYNLGLARNAAGDPAGAIQALLGAGNADPLDPRIPYARATIHARLGQMEEARRAARRALDINPQFTDAATLLEQLTKP